MEKALKQQPSNCIKVVLFGPESSGKTTLSRQLARYYNSVWVPEYAREYLQNKWRCTDIQYGNYNQIYSNKEECENECSDDGDKCNRR